MTDQDTLNSLLESWHRWAQGYQHCAGINSSPMFRNSKTSRGWDTVDDIVSHEIDAGQMAAIDFHVMQLCDVYRTAIAICARNLFTGRSVWTSARLPENLEDRAKIVGEARSALAVRLREAGVM